MVYRMYTNAELSEVEKACGNCQETLVRAANAVVRKMVLGNTNAEDSKQFVIEIVKMAKELGALEIIRDTMKGLYSEEVKEVE